MTAPPAGAYGRLHALILRRLVETGRAPTIEEIGNEWGLDEKEVRSRLRDLQDRHGCVLHPHSDEVWVIHPFANAPALVSIHAGDDVWWANCAWCGLGAAHLVGRDCRITSTLGAHGERVDLEIKDGALAPTDLLVHFPVPMTRAWDNVLYTCSTMLLFENEADVEGWCTRHGVPRGDVRRVADLWPFAREWYGQHLSEDWEKISIPRAREMFARHGLDGPIWSLPAADERF